LWNNAVTNYDPLFGSQNNAVILHDD